MTIPDSVQQISAGVGVSLLAWAGVVLTLFTFPGIWLAIACAGLAQWWWWDRFQTPMFSWWTLGICAGLGVLAEVFELVASAFGAAKAGGTKKSAVGSVVGGAFGAIIGTILIPIPILGTILGAAIGAGGGALLLEKHWGEKTWKDAGKVGAGAAAGRLAATLAKLAFAVVIAAILSVAAFV